MSVLGGLDVAAMRAQLESPRLNYATSWLTLEMTRAARQRLLPTNHGHAALPSWQSARISLIRRRNRLLAQRLRAPQESPWTLDDSSERLTTGPSISVLSRLQAQSIAIRPPRRAGRVALGAA